MPGTPGETLQAGQHIDGFEVKDVVETLQGVVYRIEHSKSGARILHLHNTDAENLFSISFPTPPPDDTGVAHILEHAVLAGSRKYPVREPFFEMIKMSMATFINAMTGYDKTYYPVASNVKKDLFNLAEVYFDAVFHPLLTEQTFKREGHHLAPADKDEPTGDLAISGIVYNEMKGAFSSPESLLYRRLIRSLLPDTIYGNESGGHPDAIPDLTYEGLKEFHGTYYHPSNGYFFLYGDIPTRDYLAFLGDKLDVFDAQTIRPGMTRQPRWDRPQLLEDGYPIGENDSLEEKTYLALQWLTGDATNPEMVVLMRVLNLILLGNEGAPLKKAVVDSKLGSDLIASGDSSAGLESTYGVGIKGSEPDRMEAFAALVTETLSQIAEDGIEPDRAEAAFQQAAYHYLEILPMFPLHALRRVLSTWIYGVDPVSFLDMGAHLSAARERFEAEPDLFSRLIREQLLENRHRLDLVLKPDPDLQARMDGAFQDDMKDRRARLTDEQMQQVAADAEELDRLNGTPNSPEALARLPQLAVGDLPRELTHIPTQVEDVDGVELLRNDVPANGVSYLILDFDLQGLPEALWPYLPRYTEGVRKLGAAGMGYEEMAHRIAANTGGISCTPIFTTHGADADRSLLRLRFSLKTLDEQMVPALGVLQDLLFAIDPNDSARLRDVLVQSLARYRTGMVHDGSNTAYYHAGRGLNPEAYLSELVNGLPQLDLCERLSGGFEAEQGDLMEKIEAIRDFLLNRGRLAVSFTGSDGAFQSVREALSDWNGRMDGASIVDTPIGFAPFDRPPCEGLAGPVQVAHCARMVPAPHYAHSDETLLRVGTHLVRMDYILSEIRFKGNAYGAWFSYDALGRMLYFGSYRDPHVARTLEVFDGVADFVRAANWTQTDIDRAIIATAKYEEQPIRPSEATSRALYRHLSGITPRVREEHYAQLREATPGEVRRALLDLLDESYDRGAVCVVSSREKLEAANREMPGRELEIRDILK